MRNSLWFALGVVISGTLVLSSASAEEPQRSTSVAVGLSDGARGKLGEEQELVCSYFPPPIPGGPAVLLCKTLEENWPRLPQPLML